MSKQHLRSIQQQGCLSIVSSTQVANSLNVIGQAVGERRTQKESLGTLEVIVFQEKLVELIKRNEVDSDQLSSVSLQDVTCSTNSSISSIVDALTPSPEVRNTKKVCQDARQDSAYSDSTQVNEDLFLQEGLNFSHLENDLADFSVLIEDLEGQKSSTCRKPIHRSNSRDSGSSLTFDDSSNDVSSRSDCSNMGSLSTPRTPSTCAKSIHLIHLLLHPVTKELFRNYCYKNHVTESYDCLEEIRLFYVAIDSFKNESYTRKAEHLRKLQTGPLITDFVSVSEDSLIEIPFERPRLRSNLFNKRKSIGVLFNSNSDLIEALQEKLRYDQENSLLVDSSKAVSERPRLSLSDVPFRHREALKEKAVAIYENFIASGSQHEINIDSHTRSIIQKSIEQIKLIDIEYNNDIMESVFEDLKLLLLRQLKVDVLVRFEKSEIWSNFSTSPNNRLIVDQVLDYSHSYWSTYGDNQTFFKYSKKDMVRDFVTSEDIAFLKTRVFNGDISSNWKSFNSKRKHSPFDLYYSKGNHYIDTDSIEMKFGCVREEAKLSFSAEEVLCAAMSNTFNGIFDTTIDNNQTIPCLKTIQGRSIENILSSDITKVVSILPIPFSNRRCCFQTQSVYFDEESNRYFGIRKPILFNENYVFEKDSIQSVVFDMYSIERLSSDYCKYSHVTICNFGGVLKHFSSKAFTKVVLAKQFHSQFVQELIKSRDNNHLDLKDGFETCLEFISQNNKHHNNFPISFQEFQSKFCGKWI